MNQLYIEVEKCPDLYGRSVLTARSLYELIEAVHPDWRALENCQTSTREAGPGHDQEEDTFIFPNPATNRVTLLNPTSDDLEDLEIYDLNGKLLKKVPLLKRSKQISLDVSTWSTGIYFLRSRSTSKTYKFSVISGHQE